MTEANKGQESRIETKMYIDVHAKCLSAIINLRRAPVRFVLEGCLVIKSKVGDVGPLLLKQRCQEGSVLTTELPPSPHM